MLFPHRAKTLDTSDVAQAQRLADIANNGALVVSTHCDDAPYSIAGIMRALATAGVALHMLTIFARSNYAPNNPGLDIDQISALRQGEEKAAAMAAHPGIGTTCLDHADIVVRRNLAVEQVVSKRPLDADSRGWVEIVAGDIDHMRKPDQVIIAPIAMGWHIDHQIVASAGALLVRRGVDVLFYEDLPYAGWTRNSRLWLAQAYRLRQLGLPLRAVDVRSPSLMALKKRIFETYASQASAAYWRGISGQTERRAGAERLWVSPKARERL